MQPELFNLETDPQELDNLALDKNAQPVLVSLREELFNICNPDDVDALAHADQHDMVERYGGSEAAFNIGAPGATLPPALDNR